MKDFHLRFYKETRWFTDSVDLLECNLSKITDTAGAYVLGATDPTMLVYPWGSSPIYYIGKANNLRKRLSDHKKFTLGARKKHAEVNWWPRYQYGAAFGTTVAWYSVKGQQNPNDLESDLIDNFYDTYGALPAANGKWPKGIKKPTEGTRDD